MYLYGKQRRLVMCDNFIDLPEMILLEDYGGHYATYINAVYDIFYNDFIRDKTRFRGEVLKLKKLPIVNNRECTFYHMTHKGEDESDRKPDLRRCERLPWAKPIIEKCDEFKLKIWTQKRKGKDRLCIWLELVDEPDYFVVLDIRKNYKLIWTAFVIEYNHQKRKKEKEYQDWLKKQNPPK